MTQFNNTYQATFKPLFLAVWPGEDHAPEIWTRGEIAADFEDSPDVLSLIDKMELGDSIRHEESNLVLIRIPDYLSQEALLAQF